MPQVTIGCRLPNGIILHNPVDRNQKVTLDGPRLLVADGRKLSGSFATTEVDADFWAAWKAGYAGNLLLTTHSIFEAKNTQEAAAKGKEFSKELTGFEQASETAIPGVEKSTSTN